MRGFRGQARRCCAWGCVLFLLASVRPAGAPAQEVVSGLAGGALGLISGGVISMGIVTLEARRGVYLSSVDDVFGWQAAPIPVGLATGLLLGLHDPARGRRALVGALVGGVTGAGLGLFVGGRRWSDPERHWAGGLIGGAAGVLVGAAAGALVSGRSDASEGVPVQVRLAAPR